MSTDVQIAKPTDTMSLFDEYKWRGMIYDATPDIEEVLAKEKVTAYIGFDPTAASLHVGSLLPMMGLARLQRYGHTPIAIAGGGTGRIGDPSGKTKERQLLSDEQIEHNLEGIKVQLSRFLDFDARDNPAQIINNAEWLASISLVDFLRDVGKYFTVNHMMAKESVKRRLESEEGLSYTEFSYMLMQAYDYLVLYDRYDCNLQMGGSDQWGNILAGTDLIRRLRGERVHGLVFPLVTNASGTKFGKTEAGNVWLDPDLTSPYRFYQFWLNTDDSDVIHYLKVFTWLSKEEIEALEESLANAPEKREAQRTLAQEVTRIVHGETLLHKAEQASQVLFGAELTDLSVADIRDIFDDVPSSDLPRSDFEGEGLGVLDLLANSGLTSSKGEARRLIQGGGIYLNNRRVEDVRQSITLADSIEGQLIVLRRGSKTYRLVQLV